MFWLEAAVIIFLVGFSLLLAGYWLAAELNDVAPSERAAAAMLIGLSSFIFMVSAVGFFRPIHGLGACVCLLPMVVTLARKNARQKLAADFRELSLRADVRWIAAASTVLLYLVLRPLLVDPNLVFFDGTENHDSFFWISGAEYLQHHSYMQTAEPSDVHPFGNSAQAIIGWQPAWGRMGAEGLVALFSSIIVVPILNTYNCATASLLLPWLAGVFLVLRTFVRQRLSLLVLLVAAALQPLFVFFHSNANLPNLIGALAACGMVVATQRSCGLTNGPAARPWWLFVTLSTHAVLCAYPEMMPFVLLPCGLLCLRAWRVRGWSRAFAAGAALLVGLLVNPATAARAYSGFLSSYVLARTDHWHSLFDPLHPAAYLPALTTLAVGALAHVGPIAGTILSMLVLALLVLVVRRACDPFGIAAILSGSAVLLLYTLLAPFGYGWQKTAQFGGIFIAAIFPAGCLAVLEGNFSHGRYRVTRNLVVVAIICFYAYATLVSCLRTYPHAVQKRLTREMLALRDFAATHLREVPILVLQDSFQRPFFYGMWASYFFPTSSLIYSARAWSPGGYLTDTVRLETPDHLPKPVAFFVSDKWAATFDLTSRRLREGSGFALLENSNRVSRLEGFYPVDGVPEYAAARATLTIAPHHAARLQMTVQPRANRSGGQIHLRVERRTGPASEPLTHVFEGEPPWQIDVPLEGAIANVIAIESNLPPKTDEYPFQIDLLRVTGQP